MFCVHCGRPLKEGARFCSACGAPAAKAGVSSPDAQGPTASTDDAAGREPAPANPTLFANQMESDRRRSRKKLSPLVIIAIVLALLAGTAFAAVFIAQQAGTGEEAVTTAQPSEATAPELKPEPEPQTTEEERVIESLNGWWQRGARQWIYDGYVYYHGGKRYRFTASGEFDGELGEITPDMVHRHPSGLQGGPRTAFADTPGYFIDVNPGDLGFYLADGMPDSLSWLREDGTGYSGGETIGRVEAPEWAAEALGALGIAEAGPAV